MMDGCNLFTVRDWPTVFEQMTTHIVSLAKGLGNLSHVCYRVPDEMGHIRNAQRQRPAPVFPEGKHNKAIIVKVSE